MIVFCCTCLPYNLVLLQCHTCTQALLESEVAPLSPTDETLMAYSTTQSSRVPHLAADTGSPDIQHRPAPPQPLLVPAAFSLPGAPDEEVSFEAWKRQQQPQHTTHTLATKQVHNGIPSPPHPMTHHPLRVTESHEESSPVGHCETDSDLQRENVDNVEQPRVQEAWGSQTLILEDRSGRSTSTLEKGRLSSATEGRGVRRKDKIVSDWYVEVEQWNILTFVPLSRFCRGFQSSATAELMLKRMHRQKRMQSNASRRQKLNGTVVSVLYKLLSYAYIHCLISLFP